MQALRFSALRTILRTIQLLGLLFFEVIHTPNFAASLHPQFCASLTAFADQPPLPNCSSSPTLAFFQPPRLLYIQTVLEI
jgi:hypothetical protein